MLRIEVPLRLRTAAIGTHLLVMHPFALQTHLQQRQQEYDHEQHPSHRAGIAHFEPVKAVLVDVIDDRGRRMNGPALRHDQRLGEHLKRVDRRDDENKKARGRQQRQGDVAEALPGGRSVDLCGFVEMFRDVLQSGQKQHHRESDVRPHAHQDQRRHRPFGAGQPGRGIGDADGAQHRVQQAVVGVEHPLPEQRDGDQRGDDRHEIDRAVDRQATHALVEAEGDQEPEPS